MNLHTAKRRAKRRARAKAGHWWIYPISCMPKFVPMHTASRTFVVEEVARIWALPLRMLIE